MSNRCPHDGGFCHHHCKVACVRKATGAHLTEPWEGFPVDSDAPQPTEHERETLEIPRFLRRGTD